jgi:hypothetical protein
LLLALFTAKESTSYITVPGNVTKQGVDVHNMEVSCFNILNSLLFIVFKFMESNVEALYRVLSTSKPMWLIFCFVNVTLNE